MYYTILEQMNEAPVLDWSYVDATEVDVKVKGAPRWTWAEKALSELPVGKAIKFPVPEGESIARFQQNIRSALSLAAPTRLTKWSIRQSKDERSVIVLKGEQWPSAIEELRKRGEWPEQERGGRV